MNYRSFVSHDRNFLRNVKSSIYGDNPREIDYIPPPLPPPSLPLSLTYVIRFAIRSLLNRNNNSASIKLNRVCATQRNRSSITRVIYAEDRMSAVCRIVMEIFSLIWWGEEEGDVKMDASTFRILYLSCDANIHNRRETRFHWSLRNFNIKFPSSPPVIILIATRVKYIFFTDLSILYARDWREK